MLKYQVEFFLSDLCSSHNYRCDSNPFYNRSCSYGPRNSWWTVCSKPVSSYQRRTIKRYFIIGPRIDRNRTFSSPINKSEHVFRILSLQSNWRSQEFVLILWWNSFQLIQQNKTCRRNRELIPLGLGRKRSRWKLPRVRFLKYNVMLQFPWKTSKQGWL